MFRQRKSLAFTAINSEYLRRFMPSEQIFPETNRWVCLNLVPKVFWMFKIWQCLATWQPGTEFSRQNTPQSEIYKDFDGKAYSIQKGRMDVCSELPSDTERYFGFVV